MASLKTKAEIEFKATTEDFKKKVKEADSSISDLKRELKLNSAELKGNSDNIDILKKRHDILQQEASESQNKIKILENELKYNKDLFGDNSVEVHNLSNKIIDARTQFQNIQNEIQTTEVRITDLESATSELDESFEDVEDSSGNLADGFTIVKGIISDLASNVIQSAISSLRDFSKEMINTSASVKAENSAFSQTFGEFEDEANKAVERVANSTGIVNTRLKSSAAQIYAFARASGASVPEALELMETSLVAAADNAAYYDKALENSTDTLQSFLKGNFANDAALGVSCTETTRNAKAMELFGKKYNELTEIQKQQALLKMVTDSQKLSGAMGQASREADGWENVTGNLKEQWRQFQALVGTPFLQELIPIIQDITSCFQKMITNIDWDKFSKIVSDVFGALKDAFLWIKNNGSTISTVITSIASAVSAYVTYTTALKVMKEGWMALSVVQKTATAVQWALNAAQSANPIGLVIAAIAALIAIFVKLWKNNESFRQFWIKLWESIKNVCGNVWNSITNFFSSAFEKIKSIWSGITNIFTNYFNIVKNVWSTIINFFMTYVINPIKNAIINIFNFYKGIYTSIFNFLKNILTVIIGLIQGVIETIKLIWSAVVTWFNDVIIIPIKTIFSGLWNVVSTGAQNAWNFIKNIFITVSSWFNSTIIQPVSNFFSGMWNKMTSGARSAWNGIKNVFSSVTTFFKNIFSNAWNSVMKVFSTGGKIFDGIKDGIVSAFKNIVNKIIDGINKVVSIPFKGINSALSKIKNVNILGQKPFSNLVDTINVPKIPRLKVGLEYVPRDFFPAFLDKGERVLTSKENQLFNELGGFEGILSSKLINQTQNVDNSKLDRLIELEEFIAKKEWIFQVNDREMARATRFSDDVESAQLINLKKRGLTL